LAAVVAGGVRWLGRDGFAVEVPQLVAGEAPDVCHILRRVPFTAATLRPTRNCSLREKAGRV